MKIKKNQIALSIHGGECKFQKIVGLKYFSNYEIMKKHKNNEFVCTGIQYLCRNMYMGISMVIKSSIFFLAVPSTMSH